MKAHSIVLNVLRATALVLCAVMAWLIYWEMETYSQGTSQNTTVAVVSQPFIEGPNLVYRWEGEVVRSCAITIRRSFIDSEGVQTHLVALSFSPGPIDPNQRIGYEVSVPVPGQIADGPAIYQATEFPRCTLMQRLFPVAIDYPPVQFTVSR